MSASISRALSLVLLIGLVLAWHFLLPLIPEGMPRFSMFGLKLVLLVSAICLLIAFTLGWHRLPGILATGGVVVAVSGAGLVASEFFVRWLYSDVTTTPDNSSYFAQRWRAENPPITNTLGFREREFVIPRPPGVYRIAIIGDSFTYGQGIAVEARLSNQLESRLRRHGEFEVLNFGIPGAETVDHIEILRESAIPSQPNFVILQWFINDVEGHDKSGRPHPLRLLPSDTLTSVLHRHSALYYLANGTWAQLQQSLGWTRTQIDYLSARFGDPASPDSRDATRALDTFISLVRSRGLPMAIVAYPRLVDVHGDPSAYPVGFLIDRLMSQCREEGIECIDLRNVFAPEPTRELWANRFDSHPGPRANALAADQVMNRLANQWILAAQGQVSP